MQRPRIRDFSRSGSASAAGVWDKCLFGAVFAAGWLLGYLPIINTWREAGPADFIFRLLLLPVLLGLLAWSLLTFGVRLSGRFFPLPWDLGGRAGQETARWRWCLKKRWPVFLLALLMALASWQQYGELKDSSGQLISYYSAMSQKENPGYALTRHSFANWCTPAKAFQVVDNPDFDSQRHDFFKGKDLNLRMAGIFSLEKETNLRFRMTSDDGSLLLIDGVRRLNLLGRHPPKPGECVVKLQPGPHALEVLYYQALGGAMFRLEAPPEVSRGMRPLSPQSDYGQIWRLNRRIEWTRNRVHILIWGAALLFLLMLAPYPRGWEGRFGPWFRGHLPLLAAVALSTLLLGLRLEVYPGMHFDEGLMGDAAFSELWYGIPRNNLSYYAWSNLTVWLTMAAQYVMPLCVSAVRIFSVLFNAAGLLLCALAMEKFLGKRAGVITALLVGTAPWYLGLGRIGFEVSSSVVFISGGVLLSLAWARRRVLGAVLAAGLLGLGAVIHIWWLHAVAGLGLVALAILRTRLLKSAGFWLGLAAFAIVVYANYAQLLSGQIAGGQAGATTLKALWNNCLTTVLLGLPGVVGGELVMKVHNAQLLVPMIPLAPILLVGMLLAWRFVKLDAAHNKLLAWLGISVLAATAALIVMMTDIQNHYLHLLALLFFLWAAVYLDGLWARGLQKTALALVAVLALYGGGMFLINGPLNDNPEISKPYQARTVVLDKALLNNSQFYFYGHDLYEYIVGLGRPVHILNTHIRAPMWFLERSDLIGRHGYTMDPPLKGGVLIFYAIPDNVADSFVESGRKAWEALGPGYLQPLQLPDKLAERYKAYLLRKPVSQ